jgi:hypothetical protein
MYTSSWREEEEIVEVENVSSLALYKMFFSNLQKAKRVGGGYGSINGHVITIRILSLFILQ